MEKIVLISDTHGYEPTIPPCDILIHGGDIYRDGRENDEIRLINFLEWFSDQEATHKIFIAGNHDFFLESYPLDSKELIDHYNVTYLQDSSVTINGIKIYGSPWTRNLPRWAFQLGSDEAAEAAYSLIPDDTDILVTHGPPKGILDVVNYRHSWEDGNVGCPILAKRLTEIQPKIHLFGHIHESRGEVQGATRFINASCVDFHYDLYPNPIVEIELA